MKTLTLLLVLGVSLAGCRGASNDAASAEAQAQAQAAKDKARVAAASRLEAERLAALWTYHEMPVGRGSQLSATVTSKNDVDTGAGTPASVRLVFRDHPSWGRSSYLVLQAGDFNCYGSCTVTVTADGVPKRMAARRPPTDDAIAMFINDAAALWRLTTGATQLAIEFPVKAGGTRMAAFDVAGLDRARLPGWSPAP